MRVILGWESIVHQLVALIAEEQLTPKAKAAIADLLGQDMHISDAEVIDVAGCDRNGPAVDVR